MDENVFVDLLQDEPKALNPCSDSIDNLASVGNDAVGAKSFTMLNNSIALPMNTSCLKER